MIIKINYEVVLTDTMQDNGDRMVAIKATQAQNSLLFDTNVWVKPENFNHGVICNHPMADKYNIYLYKYRNEIEGIELEMISRGRNASLQTIAYVIKDNISAGIPIFDFTRAVMSKSEREDSTKMSYFALVKDIIAFTGEATTIDDMTYDWVVGFNDFLKHKNLGRNTIIGKNKLCRALINEAIKRKLLPYDENPYLAYHIPSMISKRGFLEVEEVQALENLTGLNSKQRHIRDAFVFCCYTGFRYSDMITLDDAEIKNGWIIKTMYKTKFEVKVPYAVIFDGKAIDILNRYNKIESFANIGFNSTANKILKEVAALAGIEKRVTWHVARHTCATLLLRCGVPITSVKYILGHQKIETTMIYAEINEKTVLADLTKIFTPREGFDCSLISSITSESRNIWQERVLESKRRKERNKAEERKKNRKLKIRNRKGAGRKKSI